MAYIGDSMSEDVIIKVRVPKDRGFHRKEYQLRDFIEEYKKQKAEQEILKIKGILKGLDIEKEEYKVGKYRKL